MDTILILRDSVATCVGYVADNYHPCVKTGITGISWQEVFALALIFIIVFSFVWLLNRHKTQILIEGKGNQTKNESNSKEQQIAKLQDMLYKHLLTRIYIDKIDEGGNKFKEYNETNDKKYIETLTNAINELKGVNNDAKKSTEGQTQN